MKQIIIKITLFIITLIFLFILIDYAFFSEKKNNFTNFSINIEEKQEKQLDFWIFEKIDLFTYIYSKNKDYTIWKDSIVFWTWIYIINSRQKFKNTTLDLWKQKIILKNGWMLYIDNSSKYKKIISFNEKVKIEFLNKNSEKRWIEMYLFPHMYFWFLPFRFYNKEKADSSRIKQLGILNYFNGDFKQIINGEELNFISDIEKKSFLQNSLKDISKNQQKYQNILKNKKNIKFYDISGSYFIEKYISFFYNDRKKSIYFKTKILKDSIKLLNIKDKDFKISDNILKNLKELKRIDESEFLKITRILKKISFLTFYNLGEKSWIIEENYNKLIKKLYNYNDKDILTFSRKIDKYNFLWNITEFLSILNYPIKSIELNELEIEYYILFKQNILVYNLKNFKLDTEKYNILLNWIISYSKDIENHIDKNNNKISIQNIIYNKKLLDIFFQNFSNRYFYEKRDKYNLLTLKNTEIIDINELEKAIKKLFNKYKRNIWILKTNKEKYSDLIKKYDILEKQYKEYFFAFQNYSSYEEQYSKVNKAFINVDIYRDEKKWLNLEDFQNFFYYFNGISKNWLKVQIIDNMYYLVENMNIKNYDFSFTFHPQNWNKIKNISIQNTTFPESTREYIFYKTLESISFSLDNEREKYAKIFLKAKEEEKEYYDFKNFFINRFFVTEKEKKEDSIKETKIVNEDDEIIKTFKIAKLLWKGEFYKVKKYLNIKYRDLHVKRISWENYSIKIKDSNLEISTWKWNNIKKYKVKFNSKYKLSKHEHYFYDISLNIEEVQKSQNKNIVLFPNVDFIIKWKINLIDFDETIRVLFEKIEDKRKKYEALEDKNSIKSIYYFLSSKTFQFKK